MVRREAGKAPWECRHVGGSTDLLMKGNSWERVWGMGVGNLGVVHPFAQIQRSGIKKKNHTLLSV